nr:ABC transporter ATP-binding protein [uncultured Mucilaginibacter sp.]
MAKVIKVENLSKAYQLGDFGTGTVSRDIERTWARLRGKEDPFLKIGETNDRSVKGTSNMVWSLKDLNFEVEQGDAVGIIGRNGAGKSTLLKLLSRVTSPTIGSIKIKGRIASLLEVGTGFHPELTGRENIFLNGAILGMRKAEIKRKFDEIVNFSGVERYIDTPVKRYSSGMYVRLAFAVAAHLESEILIVDEVLAVGDAEFQKKCLGKMGAISKGEGRTVLFVSHNMSSIEALCNKGILFDKAQIKYQGNIKSTVGFYLNNVINNANQSITDYLLQNINTGLRVDQILVNNQSETSVTTDNHMVNLKFIGTAAVDSPVDIEVYLTDTVSASPLFFCSLKYSQDIAVDVAKGPFELSFNMHLPDNMFSGIYNMNIMITKPGSLFYYKIENLFKLNIEGSACPSGKKYTLADNVGYGYLDVDGLVYKK